MAGRSSLASKIRGWKDDATGLEQRLKDLETIARSHRLRRLMVAVGFVFGVVGWVAGAVKTHPGTMVLIAGAAFILNEFLGLINERVQEDHAYYGIQPNPKHVNLPYPGVFVLDAAGTITHKRFHQSYRVRDTGAGIPADELPRIFDRLFRGDRSRAERGLGLGLSLVKAVVEAHGGAVTVQSEVGRGAAFTVRLPT